MNTDAFIQFEEVAGEAEDKDYAGAIQVLAWGWGMHARVDQTTAKARGATAVDLFTFQHNVDLATVGLLQRCYQAYLVPKVTFVMRKAAGSSPLPYVEILFQQVRLVDISMGQTAVGAGLPLESVTFAFERVSFDYTPQSRKGSGKGRHNFSWAIPSV